MASSPGFNEKKKKKLSVKELFISLEQKLNLGNYESAGFNAGMTITVNDDVTADEILEKEEEMREVVQDILDQQVDNFKKLSVRK